MYCLQAESILRPTFSSDKNELLFKEFGINYNNELIMFRKGSTLIRKNIKNTDGKTKPTIVTVFESIIDDKFWRDNPHLLSEPLPLTIEEKRSIRQNNKKKISNEA